MTLIEGCFINALESQDDPDHNFFGFEIITSDTDKIILFSTSKESRTCWVNDLRKSAKTIPITSKYTLGPQLGKGKFSVVHMGKEMSTGKRYAIKILDKSKIDQRVKEALQQEIAILNVVRHPRIVQMKEVFETQERYYIVLRLYENGDLFQYIKGLKKKLDEKCVKKIIWNLVDAVMYLHNLGIVHRDL